MKDYAILCEDNQNDATLFQHEWSKVGFSMPVQVFDNGDRILAHLRSCGRGKQKPPCLIISDSIFYNGNGLEILNFKKSIPALRKIPTVLISGLMRREERKKAMESGAIDYWEKPIYGYKLAELYWWVPSLLNK